MSSINCTSSPRIPSLLSLVFHRPSCHCGCCISKQTASSLEKPIKWNSFSCATYVKIILPILSQNSFLWLAICPTTVLALLSSSHPLFTTSLPALLCCCIHFRRCSERHQQMAIPACRTCGIHPLRGTSSSCVVSIILDLRSAKKMESYGQDPKAAST